MLSRTKTQKLTCQRERKRGGGTTKCGNLHGNFAWLTLQETVLDKIFLETPL